jgi:RimJ/RimL family protein N-acetyltransferase
MDYNLLLKSERLMIKSLEEKHHSFFHDYHRLKEVYQYQGFQPTSMDDSKDYIKEHMTNNRCILEVLNASGDIFLGDISLNFTQHKQVEIGYSFDPSYQKKGYAYEACKRILEYLFLELDVHRVFATLVPENTSSESLIKKLNFRKEAHYIKSVWTGDQWIDDMLYAILKEEYLLKEV